MGMMRLSDFLDSHGIEVSFVVHRAIIIIIARSLSLIIRMSYYTYVLAITEMDFALIMFQWERELML